MGLADGSSEATSIGTIATAGGPQKERLQEIFIATYSNNRAVLLKKELNL